MCSNHDANLLDLPKEASERHSLDVLLVTAVDSIDDAPIAAQEEDAYDCTLLGWTFCAMAANVFMNLEPVCTLLAPLCTLVVAERTKRLCFFIITLVPIGLALGLSLYGYLHTDSLAIGVVLQVPQSIAYITHRVLVFRHPDSAVATLAFPCVHTAVFVSAMYTLPTGSIGNPAYGVAQLPVVSQAAAFLGRNMLTFLVDWAAACLARIAVAGFPHPAVKRASRLCLLVWVLVTFFGALRFYSPHIFAEASNCDAASIENSHRISCLSGPAATYENTQARLAAGDTIVIHSERATSFEAIRGNSMIYDYTRLLQSNYATGGGTEAVVVLSFVSGDRSWFHLVSRNGSLMHYAKNHPMPFREKDILDGDASPSVVTVPLGDSEILPFGRMVPPSSLFSLTGTISFDSDFPWLTRRISRADIVLETSETWSYIGEQQFQGHKLMAIENGATLIKCTKAGVTGAFDAFGNVLFRFPQTTGIVPFIVPHFKRAVAWPGGGFAFDVMVMVASVFWLGLCVAPARYPWSVVANGLNTERRWSTN